jgi:hypothetical protein
MAFLLPFVWVSFTQSVTCYFIFSLSPYICMQWPMYIYIYTIDYLLPVFPLCVGAHPVITYVPW